MRFAADHIKILEVFCCPQMTKAAIFTSLSQLFVKWRLQERARCVGCLFETKSATQTQRNYMLHRTWQELEYRLDFLRATKGAHIEVY
jgi:hypothetical protein